MSTIITFSARSFSLARSSAACRRSAAAVSPRAAVPFIGRQVTRSPSRRKHSSGEAERTAYRPVSTNAP